MEEVEGSPGFGGDVGEVILDPGPGEGLDFEIAGLEVGVWVRDQFLGLLDLRGDHVGLVVLGGDFNLALWASLFSTTIREARYPHHYLNRVAQDSSVSLRWFSRRVTTVLCRLLPSESHFSRSTGRGLYSSFYQLRLSSCATN